MKSTDTSIRAFHGGAHVPALLLLAVTTLTVSACGGDPHAPAAAAPTPQNMAPTVSAIAAQSIDQDTSTQALAFTVNDEGGGGAVTLTATSTNTTVIPTESITLGGNGGSRTVTITPAEDATGSAGVVITATDPQGLQSTSNFNVTVRAVEKSVANYTAATFAQAENDTPVQVSGFTFVQDADDDTTFDPLLQ
jgi:Bacterial Ig domain